MVNEAAVLATPEERRAWVPVRDVTRTLEPGLTLPADIAGEQLIRAMQAAPATEYLLVEPDGERLRRALHRRRGRRVQRQPLTRPYVDAAQPVP